GTLAIYFYAHYAFASITAHVLSMFAPFLLILLGAGCPPAVAVLAFAYFSNLSAGLTHYGTTHGPILFSTGYVPVGTWWRVGLYLSFVNGVLWLILGLAWWRFLGLW
ncbi:MAG: anion permease, partial [Planctomycetota bacterium]